MGRWPTSFGCRSAISTRSPTGSTTAWRSSLSRWPPRSGSPSNWSLDRMCGWRSCGTAVLKTTVAGTYAIDLAPIVIDEVRVLGSRCGPFPTAIDALADRRIDVRPLIGAEFDLDDAEAAFRTAAEPGARKVIMHVTD